MLLVTIERAGGQHGAGRGLHEQEDDVARGVLSGEDDRLAGVLAGARRHAAYKFRDRAKPHERLVV
jgi:hypothetical protein